MDITVKEQIEIDFWKNSQHESPQNFTIQNIVNKLSEAQVFLEKVEKYKSVICTSSKILEVGGGQGWASCLLKSLYPDKEITTSDISQHAIESVQHWENLFQVKLDRKVVAKSYEIPFEEGSFDLVFCFQSAHHFVKHQETLQELYRVVKVGGLVIFLHEPSCKKYIYKLAHKRVNKKRPAVPEDVLIYKDISNFATQAGFKKVELSFDPSLLKRGATETLYFHVLRKLKILQKLLPTTIDYQFSK